MLPPPQKPLIAPLTPADAGVTSLAAPASAPAASPAPAAPLAADWWHAWGDAQFMRLMDKALADAPDVRVAAARLAAAQAMLGEAQAARGIQSGVTAQAALARQSYNSGFPKAFVPKGYNDSGRIALELGYDVDLWGRNRAAVASARAERAAAALDVAQSRLALSTALASAYVELQLRDRQIHTAATWRDIRQQQARLVEARLRQGIAQSSEALAAKAEVARAENEWLLIVQARDQLRTRIAALAGLGPDYARQMQETQRLPRRLMATTDQVPLDLLGRRPDILAARARLEAAAQRIKMARASYYPNINIGAFIGVQALGLDNLFQSDSQIGQIGPAISLPIFGSKTIRARHHRAEADYEAARASYDAVLLQALREAADVQQSRQQINAQMAALEAAQDHMQNIYTLTRQRYQAGLVAFSAVLEAQSHYVQAQRALVQSETQSLLLDVALIRALGGGLDLHEDSANSTNNINSAPSKKAQP